MKPIERTTPTDREAVDVAFDPLLPVTSSLHHEFL